MQAGDGGMLQLEVACIGAAKDVMAPAADIPRFNY